MAAECANFWHLTEACVGIDVAKLRKLLKIGALLIISVRRIKIAMASGCSYAHEFGLAHAFLASVVR